jgi:hypothetical protein
MKGSLSPKTGIGGEVKESRRESGGISHADQSSSGYTEMNSHPPENIMNRIHQWNSVKLSTMQDTRCLRQKKMGKDTLRDRKRGSGLISRATKEAESSVLYGLLKETVHTSYHDSFPGRRPQENDFQENFA